ncbi:hypothetical protein DPQ22_00505, partial [Candidatus Tokpelaia sp.]
MPTIYDWSKIPEENQASDREIPIYIGCPPANVGRSIRAMMKRLRQKADDELYSREPVVGETNLRVELDEEFTDYVDGMIVRFRCPNDIAKVPDNPLLCITNIPVAKRGNDGNGLPMVMMSWDRTAKGLRVKQATGDMFVAGAHVQAVYSSIHHIWTAADYEAEQKAERHLLGDTMALLKNSPEWQKFVNDKGVFFVYTDSNMAEIQRMIDGSTNDALYNCTNFPLYDANTMGAPLTPLYVAPAPKTDANGNPVLDDDGKLVMCPHIVRSPISSRFIGQVNEGSVWSDGVRRELPDPTDANVYTNRQIADILRPHQEANPWGDNKICRNAYSYLDMSNLNKCKVFQIDFDTLKDGALVSATIGLGVHSGATNIAEVSLNSYGMFVVDGIVLLYNDGMAGVSSIRATNSIVNLSDTVDLLPIEKAGKHHLDFFITPVTKQKSPRSFTSGGAGEFGQHYISTLSLHYSVE